MRVSIATVSEPGTISLPQELATHLGVRKGEEIYVEKLLDGIKLMPKNADPERQLEIAERVMQENRDLLRKLADS
ncbi:MAG TPA: AbrB/MazE/SpoVT family DNA-binding domain-containing protein [Gammaproteobacteria bacterium]